MDYDQHLKALTIESEQSTQVAANLLINYYLALRTVSLTF